jgi:lipopolysaccharide heptosyltransferase II
MNSKFLGKAISVIMFLIDKTLSKKYLNPTERFPQQAIYPFWHGDEFAMLLNNQKNNISIMVSLSDDGQRLAEILERFGYRTVRGSSNKGAQRALIQIIKEARAGYSIAFAADGPKGPYHKLKEGLVYVAQKTGLPVVPITSSAKHRIVLKNSWEKGRIPLPFSKVIQFWDEPIYVAPEDDIGEKTALIEDRLNKVFEFTDYYYWQKDIPQYLEHCPHPNILIVQPSRLGDILFALPAVYSIKQKYPHAKISWIVDERCAESLGIIDWLDKVFIWNRKEKSFAYYKKLKADLRAENFDLSIDFHGLFKSAFLVRLAGAKFRLASSSTNGMRELSYLTSKEIKPTDENAHCIDRHMAVASYLGCDKIYSFPIKIKVSDFESVKQKLKGININNFIAMHPGGGWTSRRWPYENFAKLADKLHNELGLDIVLVGGKEGGASEKGLNEQITGLSKSPILDLTGKLTLTELFALLKLCPLFVANEAGPLHIATSLSTPSVGLLGPTNAKRTGPYKGDTVIIQHKFPCQPCRKRNCKNPVCIKSITVDEVYEACKDLLAR